MKEMQQEIEQFCQHHKLETSVENRVLDLVSEVGEIAKEVLKGNEYGRKPLIISQDMAGELGDALFSLMCIANSCQIDMHESLENVLRKYEKRFEKTGTCGSPRITQ